jgi:glycosyltransferase involved in cell wall biosynthesis
MAAQSFCIGRQKGLNRLIVAKMGKIFRVCLVTPGHLGSNPRLVKEADALVEAGYEVHVIAGDSYADARIRDASILEQAKWSVKIIPLRPDRATYFCRRLRQMICRTLFSAGFRTSFIAARAHHALVPALTAAAVAVRADIYIGHCLAALPAVVRAGSKNRARIGFDAEDFHSGEAEDHGRGELENAIARALESTLLPRCVLFTAASPLIAEAYEHQYGLKACPVLNVFPLKEAVDPQPAPQIPSFYWFSQTIGPGRGLEEFIAILRRLQRPVRLDLRGHVTAMYGRQLEEKVRGTEIELRLLAPDVPKSMVRDAAGYTAGLGLELCAPRNRDLCLTNKAFTYLLAGVPVILSRTRAQDRLAADLGDASLLIELKDEDRSARQLTDWLENTENQNKARVAARGLGRDRFNWDQEKRRWLSEIEKLLD